MRAGDGDAVAGREVRGDLAIEIAALGDGDDGGTTALGHRVHREIEIEIVIGAEKRQGRGAEGADGARAGGDAEAEDRREVGVVAPGLAGVDGNDAVVSVGPKFTTVRFATSPRLKSSPATAVPPVTVTLTERGEPSAPVRASVICLSWPRIDENDADVNWTTAAGGATSWI